jgi:hypothetical protein
VLFAEAPRGPTSWATRLRRASWLQKRYRAQRMSARRGTRSGRRTATVRGDHAAAMSPAVRARSARRSRARRIARAGIDLASTTRPAIGCVRVASSPPRRAQALCATNARRCKPAA